MHIISWSCVGGDQKAFNSLTASNKQLKYKKLLEIEKEIVRVVALGE